MENNELVWRLKLIRQLELQQKELEEQIEALKDSVKAEMSAQNITSLNVGEYSVSWKSYIIHRFDATTFKAEHSDLYEKYSKAVEAKRFFIK